MPRPSKTNSKKTRPTWEREVKVSVQQRDYLDQYISPHLVDLRSYRPAPPLFVDDQPLFDVPAPMAAPIVVEETVIAPVVAAPAVIIPPRRLIDRRKIAFSWHVVLRPLQNVYDTATDRLTAVVSGLHVSWPLPVRATVSFVIVGLLLVLPLSGYSYVQNLQEKRQQVMESGALAVANLEQADFSQAYQHFQTAGQELADINIFVKVLASVVPQTGTALSSAEALATAGQQLSLSAQDFETIFQAATSPDLSVIDKVKVVRDRLVVATPRLQDAYRQLSQVDPDVVPRDKRSTFSQALATMPLVTKSADYLANLSDFLIKFLGDGELRRYLVIFQNNTEIRPTGGFIGSYALVDVIDGQIRNLEVPGGGSYDLQGSLDMRIASPEPLWLINARWEFQDSNWFPDWPTAAEKILWFYQQAGGPSVDGVVAINSDLAQDLLGVLGPIEMASYNKVITAENFYDETQRAVELEYDKVENKPKQFIGDLVPELLKRLFAVNPNQGVAIASTLHRALGNKDLQIYSTDAALERSIRDFGWANEIVQAPDDYLMVVNANIAGQKTDRVIAQNVDHEARVYDDGSVIDTVTITRTHTGAPGDLFTGVRNVNYLRLYVPQGSTLISASGFDYPELKLFDYPAEDYQPDSDVVRVSGVIDVDFETGVAINNEFGKTVFGGWTQTDPGQTSVITFSYRLPFNLDFNQYQVSTNWLNRLAGQLDFARETASYSLIAQKQSGQSGAFTSRLIVPQDWRLHWKSPADISLVDGQLTYQTPLATDQAYAAVFIRPGTDL